MSVLLNFKQWVRKQKLAHNDMQSDMKHEMLWGHPTFSHSCKDTVKASGSHHACAAAPVGVVHPSTLLRGQVCCEKTHAMAPGAVLQYIPRYCLVHDIAGYVQRIFTPADMAEGVPCSSGLR